MDHSVGRGLVFLVLALIAGCQSAKDAGDPDAGAWVDESDKLFDPSEVIEIDIWLEPDDWDLIRHQERSILDIFGVGCLEEPFASPYTYVRGTVEVDGVALSDVGVRKKGFLGSLDDEKPSLKIKFDEYLNGQQLYGLDRLTLNNCKQDPSLVRQCIGYDLFRDADVPAPRCNFARVTVNGADLGIYAHVESVKKQFLRRHFDDDEGNLYEGTLSDFREGWTGTFEKKTNKDDPGGDDIQALRAALEADDADLVGAIEPLVDLDRFYTFWAIEVLVGHWDGYTSNTNNYFVYHDPISDQFHFMPWGIDAILVEGEEVPPIRSTFATGVLPWRLYRYSQTRDQYVSRLEELLDTVWDEESLHAEIDRMEALLSPYIDGTVSDSIDDVREFVSAQRGIIEDELSGGPPEWTQELREEICFEEIGELEVTFATTFGTLETADPFSAGSGTMSGLIEDVAIEPLAVGAAAGFDTESEDDEMSVVIVPAWMEDETLLVAFVSLPSALLVGGGVVEVDWTKTMVFLMRIWPEAEEDELVGVLGGGAIEFDQAATIDGATVAGQLSGPLVFFPF
ncbi:MAG: CotH kinase family protein [Deltaproteobacteria bacterium]|nr:CotH kinase family protein [Deltaproteobacteria bacterium]